MSTSQPRIRRLDGLEDARRWDAYVMAQPAATCFHRACWADHLRRALGHEPCYLMAERDGAVTGVLPMGHVSSLLFGSALISTPFFVYGGALADDAATRDALVAAAERLGDEKRVDYVELRYRDPVAERPPAKDLYFTFRKEISADADENMKAIPRKQRAMVRKGMQAGLVSEVDTGVDRFYPLYAASLRNLGTPILPRRWFESIKRTLGDDCDLMTITKDGRPVASLMSFWFRDEVLPYYAGGVTDARQFKAHDFMYWELMRRATERGGVRWFDYGRSKRDTGPFDFKRNWGFEPQPLYYDYRLVRAKEIPNISPANPKYRAFVNLWQRLPLWAANSLGPFLARGLA